MIGGLGGVESLSAAQSGTQLFGAIGRIEDK